MMWRIFSQRALAGRRNRHGLLVLWTMLLMHAGCAVGPDYSKPVVESPQEFRSVDAPQDSLIDLRWWELFADPMLDSLVTRALANNRDLAITASRIEEARAFYGFTKADIYPRLDVTGGASRGDYILGNKLPEIGENLFIAPTLSWEIDFWGKFRRAPI